MTALPVTYTLPSSAGVNYTASFEIYTKGTKRIFSDPKYHNKSSEVFITSDNPNTVQVKGEGITWADFFATLPMKLTKDCLTTGTGQIFCSGEKGRLKFEINGVEDPKVLDQVIQRNDLLVVSFD